MAPEEPPGKRRARPPGKKGKKKKSLKKRLITLGVVLVLLVALYFTAMFSNISFIQKYRELYIGTAIETYSHKWVTFFIPTVVIDEVIAKRDAFRAEQSKNAISIWPSVAPASPSPSVKPSSSAAVPSPSPTKQDSEAVFFTKFYMLDKASFTDYAGKNPDVLKNGYDKLLINEAGLNKKGTTINDAAGRTGSCAGL